jgi:NhaA family Na+:H+ antiporter
MAGSPQKIRTRTTLSDHIFKPFHAFAARQTSGGILLIFVTIVALIMANSGLEHFYHEFWHAHFEVGFDHFLGIDHAEISMHLGHWINDGLMAIFFFVVGLEIKREILVGELSSIRKAAMPVAAAIGGMVVPALIYAGFNYGTPGIGGWGIPMATDIAFALGILALLGDRVPLSLKVFLTALAIIDDLGAVLVIAIFYTSEINSYMLVLSAVVLFFLVVFNRLDIRHPLFYILPGLLLWIFFLKSGLHATIAGVLLAMTVPARAKVDTRSFVDQGRELLDEMERDGLNEEPAFVPERQQHMVHALTMLSEAVETPLQRMEHKLHSWTTYFIIPVFALANAGVHLSFDPEFLTGDVTLGVLLGLIIGKQIGVFTFSWLSVKLGLAAKPDGVTWSHIIGVGWLAGIGFTMSLFITNLAFQDETMLQQAKVGILGASLISGIIGYLWLYKFTKPLPKAKMTS